MEKRLIDFFAMLLKIRNVELKIEDLYSQDEMKTPVHLSLGQEAVSVGVCANLKREDTIFSNHRSHAHYLAKGGDLKKMIAEFYCKETGCSKGRGGSMHLIDASVGHLGSSAIVAGGIPHAVGAAFAYKARNEDLVAVTFFGDAACEQGVFYESMNWAAFKKLPVVFVCENNRYAVYSHLSARQAGSDLSIRSRSFDIPSARVDGMDVMAVYEKAKEAIEYARGGSGPYFLVCDVNRWRGHAGAGDPLGKQYRRDEDMDEANRRDPLKDLREHLLSNNICEEGCLDEIERKLAQEIGEAFQYAQESPLPDVKELEKYLYS